MIRYQTIHILYGLPISKKKVHLWEISERAASRELLRNNNICLFFACTEIVSSLSIIMECFDDTVAICSNQDLLRLNFIKDVKTETQYFKIWRDQLKVGNIGDQDEPQRHKICWYWNIFEMLANHCSGVVFQLKLSECIFTFLVFSNLNYWYRAG